MQHLQPNTTLQGGKYRIEQVLGQGGFGITYLAEQFSLKRKVAIKEFFMKDYCARGADTRTMTSPSSGSNNLVDLYRKKFVKEAQNLAKLHHPNIISVIEVFEENDTVYYSMPYLSGGSLYDYVKNHGALTENEAMIYIRQIAKALKYMHEEKHLCHYDVKPSNILLDGSGKAVLIDFGISKNYDTSGHETSTTPIGLSEGYAPIEQYQQNIADFSPVSDVYALGATLYFLLHGRTPISAPSRAGGTALLMKKDLSQITKNLITATMKISKAERSQNVDVFLNNDPNKNSFAGWILGIAIVAIIGFFIFNNQRSTNSLINNEINVNSQSSYSEEDSVDQLQEESVSLVDEETIKKQKEQSIKDSYLSIIDTHTSKDQDDEWWSPCYFLYDITEDGIPELWLMIKDRTANTIDASLLVYTYTEKGVKSIFNGSFGHPYHNYLCKGNGYILKVFAHMGEAQWSKYTYKNGAINEHVIFSEELNETQEDYTQPSESEVETFQLADRTPINRIRIND